MTLFTNQLAVLGHPLSLAMDFRVVKVVEPMSFFATGITDVFLRW